MLNQSIMWVTELSRLLSPFGTCTCTYYLTLMGSAYNYLFACLLCQLYSAQCHYRETVLSYPCPCSAVSMWSNSAPMRSVVARCVSMRADAADAVISHSGLTVTLCCSSLPTSTLACWLVSFFSCRLFAVIQTMNVVVINQQTHWCMMCILRWFQ